MSVRLPGLELGRAVFVIALAAVCSRRSLVGERAALLNCRTAESACFTSGQEGVDGAEQCFLIALGEVVDGLKSAQEATIKRSRFFSFHESK